MTYLIRKIFRHGMVKMSGSGAILWKFGHFGFPYYTNGCLWAGYMVQNEIIMGALSLFLHLPNQAVLIAISEHFRCWARGCAKFRWWECFHDIPN